MPDDSSIPPAMGDVRDLTAAEYDATYADGEPHQLPADLLEHLEAVGRGDVAPPPLLRAAARAAVGDLALPYMAAAGHGAGFSLPVHIRVIHCTEGPMSRGNARALAGPAWFGGPAGTSAHDIFDPGEGVEMVRPGTVAYHVGPAGNGKTRGSEHCGKVGFTRDQWLTDDGIQMLDRSARYNAAAAKRDGVLPRWLTLTQLKNLEPGFATHNDVRLALGGTTHSDPGPNFPYDVYMQLVQGYYNGTQEDDTMAALTPQDIRSQTGGGVLDAMRSPQTQSVLRNAVADGNSAVLAAVQSNTAALEELIVLLTPGKPDPAPAPTPGA